MSTEKAWSARKPLWIGGIALATLVIGFGAWAVGTEIAGAIVTSGRVEVDRNRQIVQHIDGGVVTDIKVEEGDRVEPGQILMQLDEAELTLELTVTEGQLWELMARRGRLEAERDEAQDIVFDPALVEIAETSQEAAGLMTGQSRLFAARADTLNKNLDQLAKRKAQIQSQIVGIDAQNVALTQQLDLIKAELKDQQALLDKGLAQATRVLALRREEANLAGRVGELQANRAQAEGRVTEIEIEALALGSSRREEAITTLRDLRYRELELSERRRHLISKIENLDIRAPVAGLVYGLQVFASQSVIQPAEPLMYIVPQDRPLVAAVQVPTIHVDQVYPGQSVTLKFSAFDQRTTPDLEGSVVHVSADAFQDDQTGGSFYKAEIELLDGEVEKLPAEASLVPGMPVDAFFRTRDRTPWEYLTKPLTDYFVRAFRES
ncbi:HlyD family type I secretion periplasmic adaptor subunit [Shimia sp.]|jgi:HlyD family secretion protein|uniref:HlyD family type I secretion periplasmic adaptor subunit n=1 Tax=unclassified Shimia TaxID=2630038 RepID=UPI0025CC8C37|nr:HlyD family type I secretion periplasmic adaptor subunit [Shimia sp.]MCH2067374.1 HlyD family type I secretion periplasmic adaptor subunit [Shimia sp.]